MKKQFLTAIAILMTLCQLRAQGNDSLTVNYYENYPFAYTESGKLKGIEVDIIEDYVSWLKQKKNISLKVTYIPFKEFSAFYASVKQGGRNVVGLGSVTNSPDREKDVLFSPPYLQNVAVLITDGTVPTIKTKTPAEITRVMGGLSAIAVNNSSHLQYTNALKKAYLPALKISFTESQNSVLESITTDKRIFGYIDIVAYWSYLKKNPTRFLKMQKVFSEPKEYLGFIMPKNSFHAPTLSEFFESGFGYTSTKAYHQVLEKYLGYEIIGSVEIK